MSRVLAEAAAPAPRTAELTVGSTTELLEALKPGRGARTIHLRAGRYVLDAPLVVPDGAELVGEGVMRFDAGGVPEGFAPRTETVLVANATREADVVTLGDGTRLQQLRIEGAAPAASPGDQASGNVVVIASRGPRDRVRATLEQCEIVNHSASGIVPAGPSGRAIVVLTRNPGAGAPSHDGAQLAVAIDRSIVRNAVGSNSVFAINFASDGTIALDFLRNRLEGVLSMAGGVGPPDRVRGSSAVLRSRSNLYVNAGGAHPMGWQILGGSVAPHAEIQGQGAASNLVRVESQDDRIEGYRLGIEAAAGRLVMRLPGTVLRNRGELLLRGIQIRTVGDGAADLSLHGALFAPGSGNETGPAATTDAQDNVLRVSIEGSSGSGPRRNAYANAWLSGVADTANRNRLEIDGSPAEFARSNRGLDPPPDASFYPGAADR